MEPTLSLKESQSQQQLRLQGAMAGHIVKRHPDARLSMSTQQTGEDSKFQQTSPVDKEDLSEGMLEICS